MPKISTYNTSIPTVNDSLLGTDSSDNNATKNFQIANIVDLINNSDEYNILVNRSTSDQELSAAQTKTQVNFGPQVVTDFAICDSFGSIKILQAGTYRIVMLFNAGTIQTALGDIHVDYFFNLEHKNSSTGNVYTQIFDTMQNTVYFDANDSEPAQTLRMEYLLENVPANTFYNANFAASTYVAAGQGTMRSALVARATSVTGMSNIPSAALYLNKI